MRGTPSTPMVEPPIRVIVIKATGGYERAIVAELATAQPTNKQTGATVTRRRVSKCFRGPPDTFRSCRHPLKGGHASIGEQCGRGYCSTRHLLSAGLQWRFGARIDSPYSAYSAPLAWLLVP